MKISIKYILSKIIKKARGSSIKNSYISTSSKVESGSSIVNSRMGRHSFCGYDCIIINSEIGSFCSIASKVSIGGVAHPIQFVSTSPVFLSHKDSVKAKFSDHNYLPEIKTTIGHDVWIGEGAFIKAGVSIETGAVIGMGSVVTKDIPAYSVFAGNPAKLIKYRFNERLIKNLLESKWWDFSEEKLRKYGSFFNDPKILLEKIHEEKK